MSSATSGKVWDRAMLSVGMHRRAVAVTTADDVGIQWVLHTAAGIASIAVYGSMVALDIADPAKLDPATNPEWYPLPMGAVDPVFVAGPSGIVTSPWLVIERNAFQRILIEFVVTTQIDKLTVAVNEVKVT